MRRKGSGMGPSLIELIFAVMIFALASAVCIRLFVGARQESSQSQQLTNAVIAAQSAAESFKSTEGSISQTANILSAKENESGFLQYFDKNWKLSDSTLAYYILRGELQGGGAANQCLITVLTADEQRLFQITAAAGEAKP